MEMKENILFAVAILKDLAPLLISLIAIYLTSSYQKHTKKLANDKMMKELFTEFNLRYDAINNKLDEVSKLTLDQWSELNTKEHLEKEGVIIDFFNICAEEYHWHSEGRINGNIWASWYKGMNDIYNRSEVIQNLWEEECKNEGYKSFYLSRKDEIFKKE